MASRARGVAGLAATLALLALAPAVPGARAAQEAPPGPAAPADRAPADTVAEGRRALAAGRYADAEAAWRAAAKAAPADADARLGLARTLEETGQVAEALAEARAAAGIPGAPLEARILQAALEDDAGDPAAAEGILRRAVAGSRVSAAARAALGDLLRSTGRRKEALEAYEAANAIWASGGPIAHADLVAVVHARLAIVELDRGVEPGLNASLALLAPALEERDTGAILLQADAYARNDESVRGTSVLAALRPLLDRNPSHPGAHAILAGIRSRQFRAGDAVEHAERALAVDPSHPGALEVLVQQALGDGAMDRARGLLREGLARRPGNPALRGLDAVATLLEGNAAGFEEKAKALLARDRHFGRVFDFAARALEDRRRFEEAAAMARRAVEADPLDAEGWFSLGRNLLNLGREKEAREALERSDAATPWDRRFRDNFRKVLEELEDYAAGKVGPFDLRIHLEEDAALRPIYEEALLDSWSELKERYAHDPGAPILVEVFRRAEDFSARTLGVPGLGAIGACFGRVVTLDAPGALPPGAFNWRSTLHHELAHVLTLEISRGRVPRWMTEGLSVWEEKRRSPHWDRNMDRELVDRLACDRVPGILALDGLFRGPEIGWAYYHGGLLCGWMEREFGWDRVLEMLRLYGKDLGTPEVLSRALGVTPAEFDASFLRHLRALVAPWKVRPRWDDARLRAFRERSNRDAKDLEAHLHYAEACLQRQGRSLDAGTALARARAVAPEDPFLLELTGVLALVSEKKPDRGLEILRRAHAAGRDHFDLRVRLAADAEERGLPDEAVVHLQRARAHFPRAGGSADPRVPLARLLAAAGKQDEALALLRERLAQEETDLETRMEVAGALEDRGDFAGAAAVLAEILEVRPVPFPGAPRGPPPFDAASVHLRLGRALARLGRPADALVHTRRAVLVGRLLEPRLPREALADALAEVAGQAAAAGLREEARKAANEALREVPDHAGARAVLEGLAK